MARSPLAALSSAGGRALSVPHVIDQPLPGRPRPPLRPAGPGLCAVLWTGTLRRSSAAGNRPMTAATAGSSAVGTAASGPDFAVAVGRGIPY